MVAALVQGTKRARLVLMATINLKMVPVLVSGNYATYSYSGYPWNHAKVSTGISSPTVENVAVVTRQG